MIPRWIVIVLTGAGIWGGLQWITGPDPGDELSGRTEVDAERAQLSAVSAEPPARPRSRAEAIAAAPAGRAEFVPPVSAAREHEKRLGRMAPPFVQELVVQASSAADPLDRERAVSQLALQDPWPEVIAACRSALQDPDPEVRLEAVLAMERLEIQNARPELEELAKRDSVPVVRQAALEAVAALDRLR